MNEDKAGRYHRLKRQASVASLAWTSLWLVMLLWSGASGLLRDAAERAVAASGVSPAWQPAAVVAAYVVLFSAIGEALGWPFAFYRGFLLERRYGLSNERFGGWLRDRAKSFGLSLLLSCAGAGIIYALMRRSQDLWWLPAGAVAAVVIVGLTNAAPVLLLPLFYRVKPIGRESLRSRLLQLAERAGARVLDAYEWGLAEKTKKANAALAGLGGTRRILVSDTMLAEYSDEEIEVVLAHELGHHVHGDIWKGIVFESALILAGFYLASRVLQQLAAVFALRSVHDVAGLPLLVLAAGAVSLAMMPVAHALSRGFERKADRFALELTGNPGAFISAMRRLAAQNLAEERPSKLAQWLFYSHPPVRERIADAQKQL